jgi:hypothetical protein
LWRLGRASSQVNTGIQTQTHLREGILFISWPGSGLKPARAQLITTRGTAAAAAAAATAAAAAAAASVACCSTPHTVVTTHSRQCVELESLSPFYVFCNTPNCQNYTDVRCETRPGGPLTPHTSAVRVVVLTQWWPHCPVSPKVPEPGRRPTSDSLRSKLLPVVATVDPRLSDCDSGPGTIKLRYTFPPANKLESWGCSWRIHKHIQINCKFMRGGEQCM